MAARRQLARTSVRSMTFQVRQEHIDTARRRNSNHCMIADALKEFYPDAKYISVDAQAIRFSDPVEGLRYEYFTPLVGQRAIIDWDRGDEVKPFKLYVPASSGRTKPMGWRAVHPSSPSRKGRKYKKTGRRRKGLKVERRFGVRVMQE